MTLMFHSQLTLRKGSPAEGPEDKKMQRRAWSSEQVARGKHRVSHRTSQQSGSVLSGLISGTRTRRDGSSNFRGGCFSNARALVDSHCTDAGPSEASYTVVSLMLRLERNNEGRLAPADVGVEELELRGRVLIRAVRPAHLLHRLLCRTEWSAFRLFGFGFNLFGYGFRPLGFWSRGFDG